MQALRIYILIEDPETKTDVSIKGNFDILRTLLSSMGASITVVDPTIQTKEDPLATIFEVHERTSDHEAAAQGTC